MRVATILEHYPDRKTFKCRHCETVTQHRLLKVREVSVEEERKDDKKILLVWLCEYCLDSERTDR